MAVFCIRIKVWFWPASFDARTNRRQRDITTGKIEGTRNESTGKLASIGNCRKCGACGIHGQVCKRSVMKFCKIFVQCMSKWAKYVCIVYGNFNLDSKLIKEYTVVNNIHSEASSRQKNTKSKIRKGNFLQRKSKKCLVVKNFTKLWSNVCVPRP